ncbi:LysR family transcriptional regulator [Cupriavidus oxalaticus]|uniref:LysR family transcriptional regulator n=2 Tax=Cupriavidus oxalaticus TaxID=96344 RepID=A0A5P3V964_9BURK|nr:LysR family transcriptional regulator [Cupriavidus oxalaticus]QEZ42924.1 LysR family transcriptional regulator [Cupriavidus oxalaticus]QRQ83475.1 LysR family transcriptional regulator [Cupriavidus oxalaticus]QRQ92436.1 LysR family transcriptional regulator [Cupriavidus oxalaticus]WQD87054.1 LysR family transcriptional regulator [Cupriavidus oxalaticus]
MDLRQMRQALVLSETLNFHRAAERLCMAQPPLSTAIRKLEEELGVTLFDRHPSGLTLTPVGELVLRQMRSTLFFADEIRHAASEGENGVRGKVRVGFVGSSVYSLMPRLIRAFRSRYPHVELIIEESTTVDLLRAVEEHMLDVALVRYPVLAKTPLQIDLLQSEPMMLAVSADSPLARREHVALSELGDTPFIVYAQARVPAMHSLMMHAFQVAGIQPPIAQEAVQVPTILALVESGLGVALVPASTARLGGEGIRHVPLTGLPAQMEFGIALATLPEGMHVTTRNFVALAHEVTAPASQEAAVEAPLRVAA